jgi:hypothetical protein
LLLGGGASFVLFETWELSIYGMDGMLWDGMDGFVTQADDGMKEVEDHRVP